MKYEQVEEVKKLLENDINTISNMNELNDLKVKYLGKKGLITSLNQLIKDIPNEEKKAFGQSVNEVRGIFTEFYENRKTSYEEEILNKKLANEAIDISLPATKVASGAPSILEELVEEVEELFMSMGYDVVDGPEIEEDKYNFEMLNIPKGHPARDAQDTFYLEGEEILLRSQTSPVQVRTMLKGEGKTPIRMICPGKTYRRDDDDANDSHQFL